MLKKKSDEQWKAFGKEAGYYGVLTDEKFSPKNLNENSLSEFFESGEKDIQEITHVVQKYLDPNFQPERALDFGCGVGRLLIPLARRFKHVVGVDVSKAMLEEAKLNCQKHELSNVEFIESDDSLSKVTGNFDFINSYIVLQHIPRRRGEIILEKLISILNENGIAALHFTYSKELGPYKKFKAWLYENIPFLSNIINKLRGRNWSDLYMLMESYDLNTLLGTIHQHGCEHMYSRFTNHDGTPGIFMFFQKRTFHSL